MATDYIWPLSRSSIPNEMTTSFGPRINTNRWDFHDGIDLPAEKGTRIYATRDGSVRFADEKNKDGYSSRHVVLEVNDSNDGVMYLVHLRLDSIDADVTLGASVVQGQRSARSVMTGRCTHIYTSNFCKARPIPRRKPAVTR